MASEKTTAILDAIKGLTILELADLVKEIEAEFGVSAAVSVAAPAEGAAAPAAEEVAEAPAEEAPEAEEEAPAAE